MSKIGEIIYMNRKNFLRKTKTGKEYLIRHSVDMDGFKVNYESHK